MSLLTLRDGRVYEMRETASEVFDFMAKGDMRSDGWVYLLVRQPGLKHARYKGLTVTQGQVVSITDHGLGHAVLGQRERSE